MKYRRDEYLSHLLDESSPREMLVEMFGPLVGLPEEWRGQGASEAEISLDAFAFDTVETHWLGNASPAAIREPFVELDTPDERIEVDGLGRRMRLLKKAATLPLPFTHPVATMDDWLAIAHCLADSPPRLTPAMCRAAAQRREDGALTIFGMPGGFALPRQMMGDEEACLAYIEQPELIAAMLQAAGDLSCALLARMECPLDYLFVHEDLAGKSGPLIGPAQFREFVEPYYLRVWRLAQERGAKVFSVDSDGNIAPLLDAFLAAGINHLHPLEPAAGMDIVALRKKYGRRVAFKGGIDKHALRKTPEAIHAELAYKLLDPAMRGGGVVFGLDHRIPNGVPIENYRYYVRTAREMLGMPPYEDIPPDIPPSPWSRMAI